MRVRRYRVYRSHAACTRVSDTTFRSAVENHAKGERSTRDPLVLVLRRWQASRGSVCHALGEGSRCNVCSRDVAHNQSPSVKNSVTTNRHTLSDNCARHALALLLLPPFLPPCLPPTVTPQSSTARASTVALGIRDTGVGARSPR